VDGNPREKVSFLTRAFGTAPEWSARERLARRFLREASSGRPAESLEDPPVTVKVAEEAGKTNPTATLVDRVIPFYRKAKGDYEPHSA
jgi:hypothetical protein